MTPINMDTLSAAARLALTEDEKENLAKDVEEMLSLGRVLCADGEGAFSHSDTSDGTPSGCLATASLRADEPQASLPRDVLLALAPTAHDGHVTVPRVLSDEPRKEDRT